MLLNLTADLDAKSYKPAELLHGLARPSLLGGLLTQPATKLSIANQNAMLTSEPMSKGIRQDRVHTPMA